MGVRKKWVGMALLLALASTGATAADINVNPEDGTLADGVYSNRYFGLTFPLPDEYGPGFDPARPSISGFYVLNTPRDKNAPHELDAPQRSDKHAPVMVISAQDMFFSVVPMHNAMDTATDLTHSSATGAPPKVDQPPTERTIGASKFVQVKTSGQIISHLTLSTDIRCHVVSVSLSSNDSASLDQFAAKFDKIIAPPDASPTGPGTGETGAAPACVKDYATEETIVHQVQPRLTGPKFVKIPVRIIIGKDGKVKHVHVIRATDDGDKTDIEEKLMKWEFKPYLVNGQPAEVETGLTFENK
jgi:hypothetical protein